MLRCRIKEGVNKIPYFTSEGAKDIDIQIIPRKTQDQWQSVHNEKHTLPFDFENRPPIRFLLVQSSEESDLIMNPGVSAHFNVVVGALTCSKRLSILLTNNQRNVKKEKLELVLNTALGVLSTKEKIWKYATQRRLLLSN